MTNKEYRKQYMKQYYKNNIESMKQNSAQRYQNDNGVLKEQNLKSATKYRLSQISPYYIVYLLPDHNYVGITNNIYNRMHNHRSQYSRNTDNWIELARFNTREEALIHESELHDQGYDGRHLKSKQYAN